MEAVHLCVQLPEDGVTPKHVQRYKILFVHIKDAFAVVMNEKINSA
jgi:hypothetical protein